jgi:tetratricopeptide (TPR) repeat protein
MIEGNKFYQKEDFKKAIELYEKIIKAGYEGADLYYNIGNAYYRDGKLGFAILNYEKALKMSPGDEDIEHNLTLANTKTIDRIETLPKFFLFQWWESILSFFTLSGWTYTVYFFYLLILAAIGFYFFDKNSRRQKIILFTGAGLITVFIISIVFLSVKLNRELNIKNGIIINQEVAVKQSPDENSNDAFVIHEGLKVNLEDNVDNWIKIRLQDGKIGWLPQEYLRII